MSSASDNPLAELAEQLADSARRGRDAVHCLSQDSPDDTELQAELWETVQSLRDTWPDAFESAEGESADRFDAERESLAQQLDDANTELTRLRARCERLENSQSAGAPALGELNVSWEDLKQRMFDEAADAAIEEQSIIEEMVQRTETLLADQEGRLQSLQTQLQATEDELAELKAARVAAQEALDSDALVQRERQKLLELQEEWRTKLREAEIEISVERARMARDRNQLEERVRICEAELERLNDPAGKSAGGAKGRWLARLGLNRDD